MSMGRCVIIILNIIHIWNNGNFTHVNERLLYSVISSAPTDVTCGSDWEAYTGVNMQLCDHIGSKWFKILSNQKGHWPLLPL